MLLNGDSVSLLGELEVSASSSTLSNPSCLFPKLCKFYSKIFLKSPFSSTSTSSLVQSFIFHWIIAIVVTLKSIFYWPLKVISLKYKSDYVNSCDTENLKKLLVIYQIGFLARHRRPILLLQHPTPTMSYALPKLEIPILSEHIMSFYISVPLLMLFLWPGMLFPPFPKE